MRFALDQFMPRRRLLPSAIYPYNLTARCINRNWFDIPLDQVWSVFSDHLHTAHHSFGADVHAFVLMSNHFHLLLSTPDANIDKVMNYLLRNVSLSITRERGRINQTFGGPYHSNLITSKHYFLNAYKYLYRNPVEAGLCKQVEDYRFSTLHGLIGQSRLWIPMSQDELLIGDSEKILAWLNTPYPATYKDEIRRALAKREFKFTSKSRYQNKLETIIV